MATNLVHGAACPVDALDAQALLHDMRGYLTIIRGQCHGVVRDGGATAATITRLRAIDGEIERVAAAIERIRDVLVDGSSDYQPTLLDFSALVLEAVTRLEATARARGVTLRCVSTIDSMLVVGSRPLLGRILDNVFLNAIRAAGPAGRVGVTLAVRDGRVTLRLTNDVHVGAGDPEVGWGIGRAIVDDLARRNNGTVRIRIVGGRAVLRLTLPQATEIPERVG